MARLTGTELASKAHEARAAKTLDTLVRHASETGREYITRRALVERFVAQGATVREYPNRRLVMDRLVLELPNGHFLTGTSITKAGIEYARALTA